MEGLGGEKRSEVAVSEYESKWQKFAAWHTMNPHIWILFVNYTFGVIRAGHTRFSSDAVLHRIRWHMNVDVRTKDDFKINDHYSAYYARCFRAIYPKHADLFEIRVAEENPAIAERVVKAMKTQLLKARAKGLRDHV